MKPNYDFTPTSNKFTQPKQMSEKEKGIWLGIVIGIALTTVILIIILFIN